ncbi:hypothetical protein [Vibrio sp. TBV020]|uniref:hypothetical protein n=1 Tax=Vibrio sp. TBV020 TaxID=3137398 RepID=UPI0038CD0E94
MILLITDVISTSTLNQTVDIVHFQIIDGDPTIEDITQLLSKELEHAFTPSYATKEKTGRFLSLSNECIKGMHFNAEEHNELHH